MRILFLLLICGLLLTLACSSDDPAAPEASPLRGYLLSIDTFPDPSADNDGTHKEVGSATEEETTPEGRFVCTTTEYRMDKNMDEIVAYDINAVSLWPGAVIQGQDLDNGVLNLIALPRAPLRVGTNLPGLDADENSRLVDSPDHLSVRGAINEIVDTYLATESTVPARLSFHETFAESYQQAMLDLSISVEWSGWNSGSVQTDFAASSEDYETAYYCQFTQAYFTASALPPSSPEDLFQASVVPADCEPFMADGNPPCYLSGVTFGRIGILAVYSNYERRDVQLAVQAAYSQMGFDLDSDMSAYYESILNESEMKLLILGGNATDGVQAILGDPIAGLRQWIENGAELSESSHGLPISYTANYLKDNRLASFGYATEWDVVECFPVARRFHLDIHTLVGHNFDDGLFDNELEVYYTFSLWRQLPNEQVPTLLQEWVRDPCDAYNMNEDSRTRSPDAEHYFDMPDLTGAQFYVQFYLGEDDGPCGDTDEDDLIGNYSTTGYGYPLWQEENGDCSYPAGWPDIVGDSATCSQVLSNDGMRIDVFWDVNIVE